MKTDPKPAVLLTLFLVTLLLSPLVGVIAVLAAEAIYNIVSGSTGGPGEFTAIMVVGMAIAYTYGLIVSALVSLALVVLRSTGPLSFRRFMTFSIAAAAIVSLGLSVTMFGSYAYGAIIFFCMLILSALVWKLFSRTRMVGVYA